MEQNIIILNSYLFEISFKDISIVVKNYEGFQDWNFFLLKVSDSQGTL